MPRHRTVHRTGIDIGKSKPLCQSEGNAALTRSSRSIDGNDAMRRHTGKFFIGNCREASAASLRPEPWNKRDCHPRAHARNHTYNDGSHKVACTEPADFVRPRTSKAFG